MSKAISRKGTGIRPGKSAARRPRSLSAFLEEERDVLVSCAVAGGLCHARPRASPDRVLQEAARFVKLLSDALDPLKRRTLGAEVRREIRDGAFAAASAGDLEAVFDVWRRTLSAFAACVGRVSFRDRLLRALAGLQMLADKEAGAWAAERIDVVVIGASAGGIQALTTLLGAIHEGLPATILVVQHVNAKTPSRLHVVLGRACRLPVVHAVEGAYMHLGVVYIAPPGHHLMIVGSRLRLSDAPPVRRSRPAADVLFESAARAHGPQIASIVLSGIDGDGAQGSVAVRDAGGVVIAQQPGSAQFPGMPESAIGTGAVELVVSLPMIGAVVEHLVRDGRTALRESIMRAGDGG